MSLCEGHSLMAASELCRAALTSAHPFSERLWRQYVALQGLDGCGRQGQWEAMIQAMRAHQLGVSWGGGAPGGEPPAPTPKP